MPRDRRAALVFFAVLLAVGGLGLKCPPVKPPGGGTGVDLPGLQGEVRVVVDRFGTPHLFGETDLDVARVQGYVHARDRFFQMDLTRREVGGDRAEVLGPDYLDGDIQNRTIGLRRAAERSLAALSAREQEVLQAYAEGVNAWLDRAESTGQLPSEYADLELTTVRRWEPVDTLAIGKGIAASLSLDIDAGATQQLQDYVEAGDAHGFDGFTLLTQDVRRSAPMDPASTVPDATGDVPFLVARAPRIDRGALARRAEAARAFAERARQSQLLRFAMRRRELTIGSNHWGVTAAASATGFPIIANDPHLSLDIPATFYENHLVVSDDPVEGPSNVHGITFPGVPAVILGQNESITWGATTNPMDVTDLFDDVLVRGDPACTASPLPLCIRSGGQLHPVTVESSTQYLVNTPDDGVLDNLTSPPLPLEALFIFTVPFRSFGPIVDVDDIGVLLGTSPETETHVLVLQFTGFHATREVQTFRAWNKAQDLDEFREGLRSFDFGSQNWAYADKEGNLAYFASAENPLRTDLESGQVVGLPPYVIRDGESGQNNWVPDPGRSQGQSIPFAVLPEDEMPQAINPANGFFANANNDPAGTTLDNDPLNQRRPGNPNAIYYLNPGYDEGLRAGRITRLVRDKLLAGQKITVDDMKRFQGNTQQLDAELMVPFLLAAHANAGRAGAPPALAALHADGGVAEAIGRLASWDFSTPTGIPEGYDAHDRDGQRLSYVGATEAANSVAATIYNVWRAKAIRATINARLSDFGLGVGSGDALKALHHLLTRVPYTGVGASGVDFVPEPAALSAADRRDLALLGALRTALDALASNDFAQAFGNSTDQDDYRWGRLHRITFDHPLGGARSVPPANGFQDLAQGLPGLSRDGGYEVVNASGFSATADRENSFRFGGGPVRRYVGVAGAGAFEGARVVGWNAIPGGATGEASDPLYTKQLPMWLTVDRHPVEMFETEAAREAISTEVFTAP